MRFWKTLGRVSSALNFSTVQRSDLCFFPDMCTLHEAQSEGKWLLKWGIYGNCSLVAEFSDEWFLLVPMVIYPALCLFQTFCLVSARDYNWMDVKIPWSPWLLLWQLKKLFCAGVMWCESILYSPRTSWTSLFIVCAAPLLDFTPEIQKSVTQTSESFTRATHRCFSLVS